MTLRQRLLISGLFTGLALSALATAKHYSASMIAYVVEEALVQKLPEGTDPRIARSKFHSLMTGLPDRKSRVERLLSISQYLEKLQVLNPRELDTLLTAKTLAAPMDPP